MLRSFEATSGFMVLLEVSFILFMFQKLTRKPKSPLLGTEKLALPAVFLFLNMWFFSQEGVCCLLTCIFIRILQVLHLSAVLR
jgi:hypothetical protein